MTKSGKKKDVVSPLGLGPKSTRALNGIGIFTRMDMERAGSVAIYIQLKRLNPKSVSLNLLYGMEAVLLDIHWTKIPKSVKAQLKQEVSSSL